MPGGGSSTPEGFTPPPTMVRGGSSQRHVGEPIPTNRTLYQEAVELITISLTDTESRAAVLQGEMRLLECQIMHEGMASTAVLRHAEDLFPRVFALAKERSSDRRPLSWLVFLRELITDQPSEFRR